MCFSYVYRSLSNHSAARQAVVKMMINYARISNMLENIDYRNRILDAVDYDFQEMIKEKANQELFVENIVKLFQSGIIFDQKTIFLICRIVNNKDFSNAVTKLKKVFPELKRLFRDIFLHSLESNNVFLFETVCKVKLFSTQLLKDEKPLHTILTSGTILDFEQFLKTHPNHFDGLNVDRIFLNLQILNFCSLVEGQTEIKFEDVSQKLKIESSKDLIKFIIYINSQQIGKIRINSLREVLIIDECQPRSFNDSHWDLIMSKLFNLADSLK